MRREAANPPLTPMGRAIRAAEEAAAMGEVPVGACIVDYSGAVIAVTGNRIEAENDPTAHAELLALREAGKRRQTRYLTDCDLYVTLEPCPMCAQAASLARIRRLYFGAYDPKGGGVEHGARIFNQPTCHHRPEVYSGIEEVRCGAILTDFFCAKRLP